MLRGTADLNELFARFPEDAERARAEAWHAELGTVDHSEVRQRIDKAVGPSKEWVLIGGPPCQAYSVVGRSRNKGIEGYHADRDRRQYLYEEVEPEDVRASLLYARRLVGHERVEPALTEQSR